MGLPDFGMRCASDISTHAPLMTDRSSQRHTDHPEYGFARHPVLNWEPSCICYPIVSARHLIVSDSNPFGSSMSCMLLRCSVPSVSMVSYSHLIFVKSRMIMVLGLLSSLYRLVRPCPLEPGPCRSLFFLFISSAPDLIR